MCYYEKKMILAETYMKKRCVLLFLALLTAVSVFAKGKYSENDIGKIVLKSGKLVSVENYDRSSFEAVAIVYKVSEDGTYCLGVGIHTKNAQWTPKGTYGSLSRIQGLEDLKDGSKVFDIIRKTDPEGFRNLKENYPALYFASNYGKIYNVGKYADGWYVPTLDESPSRLFWNWSGDGPERWGKVSAAWEICTGEKLFFDSWCSDSRWLKNDYDSLWGGYFYDDVPADIEFSLQNLGIVGESGASPHCNWDKYEVLVVRKFN